MTLRRRFETLILLAGALVMIATSPEEHYLEAEDELFLGRFFDRSIQGVIHVELPETWEYGRLCLHLTVDRPASDVEARLRPSDSPVATDGGGSAPADWEPMAGPDFTEGAVCSEFDRDFGSVPPTFMDFTYEIRVASSTPVSLDARADVELHSSDEFEGELVVELGPAMP